MLGPGSGTIRRCGLVGVVWPCWRKCATMGNKIQNSEHLQCHAYLEPLNLQASPN
ncbi:hypothetical protein T4D_3051 [Trichinella pseudospiralis]|uniref:Uncharacterized protein n=1 Tax=Trichinella pseudospiralis TaxID=6337 RepID=A0A0V1DLA4_TRIPS|nr:hypothetical protein T4D_3051 [Trichinella pseudospiralis]